MNLTRLPIRGDTPSFKLRTVLDGQTYGFDFVWNVRSEAWFVAIYDAAGNPLVQGQRVAIGVPFAFRPTLAGLFPGLLWAVDTSNRQMDPGLNDLGGRVQVVYVSANE